MTNDASDAERTGRGVVAVIRRDSRLLAIRRSLHVAAPGMICFPGGGVEPGEDEQAAVVRELEEELALAIAPGRRLWSCRTAWGVDLAWWSATIDADAEPRPHPAEVAEAFWIEPAELAALDDLLPSNRGFLAALASGAVRWGD